jgi:hypothetical protein
VLAQQHPDASREGRRLTRGYVSAVISLRTGITTMLIGPARRRLIHLGVAADLRGHVVGHGDESTPSSIVFVPDEIADCSPPEAASDVISSGRLRASAVGGDGVFVGPHDFAAAQVHERELDIKEGRFAVGAARRSSR